MTVIKPLIIISDTKNISIKKVNKMIKKFVKANNVNNFVPYEQLTYDIVCSWLNDTIDVETLDLNLDAQIETQVNPPIVVLPLPFVNP